MVNDSTRLVGGKHVLRSVDHLTARTSTLLYADRGRNCELYTEAVRLSNGRAKFQRRDRFCADNHQNRLDGLYFAFYYFSLFLTQGAFVMGIAPSLSILVTFPDEKPS